VAGTLAHAQADAPPASPALAAPPGADERRHVVAPLLALATLAAALLRIPFLATQSFWFDETYSVHVVGARSLAQLWSRIGATESTPPLFYVLTWGWSRLAGDRGEATMRAVSALALIAAVPVAYVALRRLVGWRAALAAAGIVAASPLLDWYALDARAYGLLVLTGLVSVWACGALLEEATRRRWALWALAAAATVWTHWFAGFLVLGEVVALLWLRPRARRAALLAAAAVLLALAPLVPLLHDQTSDARADFIAGAGLGGRLEQLVRQFAAGPNVPRTWLEAASLALAAGGLAAGTWIAVRIARRGDDGLRALFAIGVVALLVPLALAASGVYDRFNVRNVLFLLPLAAALATRGLLRARAAPLAALLALSALTALWVQSDWRYENTDWRGALRHVEAIGPGDPVIAVTQLGGPVAALYLARPPITTPLATRRAWLVVEPARTTGDRALQPTDPPIVATLLAAFPSHRERQRHGFRLIELAAPVAVALDPARLPGATLFGRGR
jgi:4-amino-4-deoxy-L-arabinose transferase-like glycosyltransferase